MTPKRLAVVVSCLAFGLCFVGVWAIRPFPRTHVGGLSITFVGLTNDASGATLAQFTMANAFSHSVRVLVGDVEVLQTNGWPDVIVNTSGYGFERSMPARSHLVFSLPVPTEQGATWRVPLGYKKNRVGVERWWFEDVEKAVYDLRGGQGPQFYRLPWSFTNSQAMVGIPKAGSGNRKPVRFLPNKAEPAHSEAGSQPLSSPAIHASPVAGSHR